MIKEINTNQAPAAIGPYSQAVQIDDFIFLSGQLGIDPRTGKLAEGGISEQTHQVFRNIEGILKAAGLDLTHVVRSEIFMKDLNNFKTVNEIYSQKFSALLKPARQTVEVARLPMDALIEISCIACKKK